MEVNSTAVSEDERALSMRVSIMGGEGTKVGAMLLQGVYGVASPDGDEGRRERARRTYTWLGKQVRDYRRRKGPHAWVVSTGDFNGIIRRGDREGVYRRDERIAEYVARSGLRDVAELNEAHGKYAWTYRPRGEAGASRLARVRHRAGCKAPAKSGGVPSLE